MLLMDGVNSIFVANQLGHSLQMLIKRYAKWIHGEQNRIEISKLNTTVALNKVPFSYLKECGSKSWKCGKNVALKKP
jgi:hypothetical protein